MASDTDVMEVGADVDPEQLDVETAEAETASGAAPERPVARKVSPLRRTATVRRRPPAIAVLSALLAAFVAMTVFFGYHYFADSAGGDSATGDRQQVLDVANDYATKLASFDYRDLNKNRDAITAMSTQGFAQKYDEMVKALTEIVSNGQGVATAKVAKSAVASIDGDKATAILFVDQKATNVVAPNGKDQPYRMVLTMKRDDGKWLVDDVQTV
ncbi:hypothetical protein [Gordonia neofelifaecis]|uniref:Mce-associated membrane protein n=1 Tax=Gordonia neofelifaecis NRRL B-59395 TaxID=644548 RepID=F1YKY8_9ACTN|nr:hypothetical protein [Gordonia neofelifaecis]EGD54782.1 hypothetical protein SCNU_12877 [Gordonia neofelifaecis NRRL B-59395]